MLKLNLYISALGYFEEKLSCFTKVIENIDEDKKEQDNKPQLSNFKKKKKKKIFYRKRRKILELLFVYLPIVSPLYLLCLCVIFLLRLCLDCMLCLFLVLLVCLLRFCFLFYLFRLCLTFVLRLLRLCLFLHLLSLCFLLYIFCLIFSVSALFGSSFMSILSEFFFASAPPVPGLFALLVAVSLSASNLLVSFSPIALFIPGSFSAFPHPMPGLPDLLVPSFSSIFALILFCFMSALYMPVFSISFLLAIP